MANVTSSALELLKLERAMEQAIADGDTYAQERIAREMIALDAEVYCA